MTLATQLVLFALAVAIAYIASCDLARPMLDEDFPAFDTSPLLHVSNDLRRTIKLGEGQISGPETIIFDQQDNMYALTDTGDVVRIDQDAVGEMSMSIYAHVGGRPLGGAFCPKTGDLYVAEAVKGLLRIKKSNTNVAEVVSSKVDRNGSPILFCDDVDIGPKSGKVYFSDASSLAPQPISWLDGKPDKWGTLDSSVVTGLDARKTGRLLVFDPSTHRTEVLLDQLWFANGVAVAPDESFVLVCETFMARIVRLWLSGPKAGQRDVFSQGFPGFCDGIKFSLDGSHVYAAIPSPAPPVVAVMKALPVPVATFLRNMLLALPLWLRRNVIKPLPLGCVLQISALTGKVTRAYNDEGGLHIRLITAVTPHADKLYLGGIRNTFVGVFTP